MAGRAPSGDLLEGERGRIGSMLSELAGSIVYGVLTCVFAIGWSSSPIFISSNQEQQSELNVSSFP